MSHASEPSQPSKPPSDGDANGDTNGEGAADSDGAASGNAGPHATGAVDARAADAVSALAQLNSLDRSTAEGDMGADQDLLPRRAADDDQLPAPSPTSSDYGGARRLPTNLSSSAVRSVLWTAGGGMVMKVLNVGVFLILARSLAPADFGVVALATFFTALLMIIIEAGFGSAIIQRPTLTRDHLDTAFWLNLVGGALLAAVLFTSAGTIAWALGTPELRAVLRVLSFVLLIGPLGVVQSAILHRELRYKELTLRNMAATTIASAVAVVVALSGGGYWALVVLTMITQAVGIVLLWRVANWRPRFRATNAAFRDLFSFSAFVLANRLTHFSSGRVNALLLGTLISPAALGLYTVSTKIRNQIADLLIGSTTRVAFPVFSKIAKEPERLRRAYLTGLRLTSAVALPAFAGLSVLAPEFVPTVFGPQWAPAIVPMAALSLIGVVNSIAAYNAKLVSACGKPAYNLVIDICIAITAVIVALVTIPYGLEAVAIGQTIRVFAQFPIRIFVIRRLTTIRFRDIVMTTRGATLATTIMVASILAVRATGVLPPDGWIRLLALMATGAVAYAVPMALLDRDTFVTALRVFSGRGGQPSNVDGPGAKAAPPQPPEDT